eukprot:365321-Chlamydomonas_euryale.AAC.9
MATTSASLASASAGADCGLGGLAALLGIQAGQSGSDGSISLLPAAPPHRACTAPLPRIGERSDDSGDGSMR